MKNTFLSLLVLALVSVVSGCAAVKNIVIPTEKFAATLCADGAVQVPCTDLGTVSIPTGGNALVGVVVAMAGPLLEKTYNLKSCLFTTFPEVTGSTIKIEATATCKLQGVPVSESISVSLTPAT